MESVLLRSRMKDIACIPLAFAIIAILSPLAHAALPTPTVTFIPSEISVNSSFLLVVDPKVDDSVRVTWLAPEAGAFGQVPKIGDRWVCYFSNTDSKSTCGPNPFIESNIGFSPYAFLVETTDSSGSRGNRTVSLYIGGVVLQPDIIANKANRTVDMVIYPSAPVTGVSYAVYYSGNLTLVPNKNGELEKQVNAYVGHVVLGLDEYYIVFSAETSGGDHGGAVARVDVAGDAGGGGGETGYVEIDPVNIYVLINNNQKWEKSNLRITNLINETLTSLSVRIPSGEGGDVNNYLSIKLANTTLGPLASMYFSVILEHVVNSMGINTEAELRSNNSVIGYMPIQLKVSVKNESGSTMASCTDKPDMSYCYGGICCSEVCRELASCCDDSDCAAGGKCTNHLCVTGSAEPSDKSCISGTCYISSYCPSGMTSTGYTCVSGGLSGVCCETSASADCTGKSDGESCGTGKICCSEECISGNCCDDTDCPIDQACSYSICSDKGEGGGGGIDMFTIIIIVVIIAAVAALLYFKKFRKKGIEEEMGGEEGFEEEFY
jgi:hypothetical protein